MDFVMILQLLIVLGALYVGSRYGSLALGAISGIGGHLLTARENRACELVLERFSCEAGRRFDPETGLFLYEF